jgi:hypothetical protein
MAEKVNIEKTVLNNGKFQKAVDTSFKYYVKPTPAVDTDTIPELFRLYNKLFFSIPVTGTNSHEYLVTKSSELFTPSQVNEEIQPLLDEIAELRQRLLEANQEIFNLSGQ